MKSLVFASVCFVAMPAFAAQWNVDPAMSKLTFSGEQSGDKFEGSFPKFASAIDFDEAAPEKGHIHITVTMANVQIDGKDRMDALPTADWFDVKQFAVAEFTSDSIKKTGAHQFVASGQLNIRGVTKPTDVPFTLNTAGKSTVATGEITLNRHDFGIGQGRWASDEWIKYPVKVAYEIHATAR